MRRKQEHALPAAFSKVQRCAMVGLLLAAAAGCSHSKRPVVTEVHTPYKAPLESPGTKFGGLPPAAQNTIRAEVGIAPIDNIVKETDGGQTVYKIYLQNSAQYPPLFVAPDGSVLNPNRTVAVGATRDDIGVISGGAAAGLKPSDLPPNVMKTAQQRAPDAEISFITREKYGDTTTYIILFKDPMRHPSLAIREDGVVVP